MKDSNPKVSIIIPTYKRGLLLLKRAVESAEAQTYPNIEIIIVDDNADKNLKNFRRKTRQYESQKENIIFVYNNNNLGGALSRNEGIKVASGEFITFLDDDDYYLPAKIEHQVNYMLKNKLNCSFTDLSIYNENDRLIDRRIHDDIKSFESKYLIKYHLTRVISGTETFMVSKQLLLEVGCFDDVIIGHEFFLMYKILCNPMTKIGYFKSDDIKAYRTGLEAISTGPKKIIGEKFIYNFKKEHFDILDAREKNYINCRHRAVMAVAYLRNKKYCKAILYLLFSFITNPFTSIREVIMLKKRKKAGNNI